jgi:uncharacterized lipoprotein YajG
MRKLLILAALVLIIVLAGCSQKAIQKSPTVPAETPEARVTANATVSGPAPPAETKPSVSVTKSDLDNLKAGLDNMQFEDIGGIS